MKASSSLWLVLCLTAAASIVKGQTPPADVAKRKAELAALEKKQVAAKTVFDKSPKKPGAKASFIELSNKLAYETMMARFIPSKERYPKALRLYRSVLKVDPKNETATMWKRQIEDIYKSLGRPIPP